MPHETRREAADPIATVRLLLKGFAPSTRAPTHTKLARLGLAHPSTLIEHLYARLVRGAATL